MPLNLSYFKEALKEPINIAGLLVSGAAAAAAAVLGSWGWIEPTMILGGALVAEGFYLTVVPKTVFYRRRVEHKSRALIEASRRRQREEVIKTFDPREREAVDYLSWLKKQISDNYRKFARLQDAPPQLQELETTWEAFVDLLDEYRRRKNHLRTINRQAVENQLRQAERAAQMSDETTRPLHEKNVAILHRRLQTFDDIERSVKRVEAQLQMIENFFNLVNDQVVTMPTPEHISTLDFDTLLSSIEMTKEILQQTAPIMSQLDTLNREASQLRPSLATERR